MKEFFNSFTSIIKNNKESSGIKYFEGTINLKNNFNHPELKIYENSRKFKSKINNSGYEEVFLTEDQKIFACLTPQISFIFPYGNRENRIGFRYYKSNPLETKEEIPFFTLIKTNKRKFLILEKNTNINDFEGKNFIDNELDCIEIIYNILKNKYVNKKDEFEIIFPYSLVELIGFCYAIKEKKSNDKIEILEPYFPDYYDPSTKTENFNKNTNKIYFEPLICNKHISLLLFKFDENLGRLNLIFDYSSMHYENLKKYDPIFKIQMSNTLLKFPSENIQFGASCSIWFVSTFLVLIEDEKNYKLEKKEFLYKIINKIENIMNVKENESIVNLNKISEREFENVSLNNFVSYNIIFNYFIDIKGFLSIFYQVPFFLNETLEYFQLKFFEIRKKIDDLYLNSIYYQKVSDVVKVDKNKIEELKSKFYDAKIKLKDLFTIGKKLINKNEEHSIEYYLELKKNFKEMEKELKEFIRKILYNETNLFIEFTRMQFFDKIIDSNDIYLQSIDQ